MYLVFRVLDIKFKASKQFLLLTSYEFILQFNVIEVDGRDVRLIESKTNGV